MVTVNYILHITSTILPYSRSDEEIEYNAVV